MSVTMSIRMGTCISMGIGMSISHGNRDKVLLFILYSANDSHGARTASARCAHGI